MTDDADARASPDAAISFEPHRRYLLGLAYRMLGSVTEAEDMVQETYLRWHQAERHGIVDHRAYLSKVATRLCLDHLRSARVRRESYVGPWLPEPLLQDLYVQNLHGADDPETDIAADLSVAMLLALERLSPLERAAFLLHDVFDQEFDKVAEALGRSETACRQLAARARRHVREARPRFTVSRAEGARLAEAFHSASRSGDIGALQSLLSEDVAVFADGGGRRIAALNPIEGRDKTIRFFAMVAGKTDYVMPSVVYRGTINGLPGYATIEQDGILQTTAVLIADGRIATIYVVRNPDKLKHLRHLLADPQI